MLIGYARVSTNDQETRLQLDALKTAGVTRVFSEKGSSVGPRPQLHRAMAALTPGSTLVVYKVDRLARSLKDLLQILERMKQSGVALRSLTEPIDTSSAIGELVLQILGAVAQFERALIRERAIAGQISAYRRGVALGRRHSAMPEETIQEMRVMYATGLFTYPDIAAFFNVHPSTAKRLITGRSSRPKMPVLSQYLQ